MATPDPTYRADDRELLVGLYRKFLWDHLVKVIPAWVPPNAITVFGNLCVLMAVVTAALAANGLPSMYLLSAALLLLYLTADNVDGPHARRTGQASPVGEFLDHGLDGLASGAVFLAGSLVLGMDATFTTILLVLGAVSVIVIYWEQYRTGTLVIPAMSATEGVTLVIAVDLTIYLFGMPAWMQFTPGTFTVATGVLLFVLTCLAVALLPPLVRSHKAGARLAELVPLLAVALAISAFSVFGASGLATGVIVTVYAADIGGRLILARHGLLKGGLLTPLRCLVILPLIPMKVVPELWTPAGWAGVALICALAGYATTLTSGIVAFKRQADESEAVETALP